MFRLLIITLICTALTTCTLMPVSLAVLDQDIDLWLSKNEFDNIDNALNKLDPHNPKNHSVLRKKSVINKRKSAFIKNELLKASRFKQSQQWEKALQTYDSALAKIHNEPRLIKAKKDLLQKRDAKIIALQKTLLMKRATALISYKKIYGKLSKLTPLDSATKANIKNYNRERINVAKQLEICGNNANKAKKFTQARDCYYLSNTLEPSKQKQVWVKLISKQLKNKFTQKRHDELLTAYNLAYNAQNYSQAQMHLQSLLSIDPAHEQAQNLLLDLNREINTLALNKIAKGKELYSQKKINDALQVWQQALKLDPKNEELIQLISRAEKVSKKIQSLQESQ